MDGESKYTYGDAPRYAPFPDSEQAHWVSTTGPDTGHLPDNVVEIEFALIVISRTTKEDPRRGSLQISLQWGDRANPRDLNAQEAEYLREILLNAVRMASTG